ncbi:hypothetical protein J2S43_004578 [Catenuloplanes nepalensis]|uniref:Uncharacterized protein n=1 Tax=Catenuloplanes nepalensis TaxID=587533 RepID=A0ABT9MXU5_9ACTN|nr:hypothetical protein [Catenuloplanes nepalensis]MDP9796066.1 hypothetical protein [Catenuloplanes nepalensis]
MDRRSLLTGVAAAGLVIGLPGPASAAPSRPTLEYGHEGGFVPSGWNELRAPALVIYRDGTAIADAARRWRLRDADRLVRQAVAVVRDPVNGKLMLGPDDPQIADAPHTYFAAGGRRLSAYALETYREYGGYPAVTYALYDTLEKTAARVRMRGDHYHPDSIKLVATSLDSAEGEIRPWPKGVATPLFDREDRQSVHHRYGADARAAVRGLPRDNPADWRVYLLPTGRLVTASWRRLLPHERG